MEITLIAVLVLVGLWLTINKVRGSREPDLRRELRSRLRLPPHMAESVIDDYVDRLRKKHPGRTEQWYLEKAAYDLLRVR